jgi:hypothetical protein
MRLAVPLAIAALTAALLAGCGGSSSSGGSTQTGSTAPAGPSSGPVGASARGCDTGAVDVEALRAVGVSCGPARQVMLGWRRDDSCSSPSGASRTSCTIGSYRCLGARADRGIAVACSRPGESIAFIAKRR